MVALMLITCGTSVFAQTTKEERKAIIKERIENRKIASSALGKKVEKVAKKQAKAFAKDGWKPAPGGLPLESQLADYYTKCYQQNGSFPTFIIGKGEATGSNYAAAKKQAMNLAIVNVAEMLQAEVTELTEMSLSNKEISEEEAASINTTVSNSMVKVQGTINNVRPVVEMQREANGKKQVTVQVVYDGTKAQATLLSELESQSKEAYESFKKTLSKD